MITFRKIHIMIKEMANCVNESFGYLLFLRFIVLTIGIVRFGHVLLMKIGGPTMAPEEVLGKIRR
jgi:hypothetical protein